MDLFSKWMVLMAMCCVACSHPVSRTPLLQRADSLLYVKPREALQLLTDSAASNHSDSVLLMSGQACTMLGMNDRASVLFRSLVRSGNTEPHIRAQATFELARMGYYKGANSACLDVLDSLSTVAAHLNNPSLEGWIALFQGKVWRMHGDFVKSQQLLCKSRNLAVSCGDVRLQVTVLLSMGKNYLVEGNKPMAIKNYLDAKRLTRELNDNLLSGEVCNHLGSYYLLTDEPAKALDYHRKGLDFRMQLSSPDEIGQSYNNLGKCYLEMDEHDSALVCFQKALDRFQESGYMKGQVKTLNNLGLLYLHLREMQKGKKALEESYDIAQHSSYQMGIAEASLALGDYYRLNHQPDSAIHIYNRALKALPDTNYDDWLVDVYKGMYECYKDKGNRQAALRYHEMLLDSDRQRLNVENNRQISALILGFDFERQENVNQLLRKDLEVKTLVLRRNRWILVLALVVIILITVIARVMYTRMRYQEKSARELEVLNDRIRTQNDELALVNDNLNRAVRDKDKLFSIISHELRNPLYWFKNLTGMLSRNHAAMDRDKLHRSINSLNDSAHNVYHLMDNLLFWSRSQLNRIEPRMTTVCIDEKLEEVLELFAQQCESREIELAVKFERGITVTGDADLLACVFRNVLSNAIKFTPNKGKIRVSVKEVGSEVVISVSDNGRGIPEELLEAGMEGTVISQPGMLNEVGAGLGLRLSREFVGMHGGNISFQNRSDGGALVRIVLSHRMAT